MREEIHIGGYIEELLNIVINIISNVFNQLDNIYITENVTILSILVFLAIIGAIIPIILTIPQNSKMLIKSERRRK